MPRTLKHNQRQHQTKEGNLHNYNDSYKRYHTALHQLSLIPDFKVVLDYWAANYLDPSVFSENMVKLGMNLGKKELVEEVIRLSNTKVTVKQEVE